MNTTKITDNWALLANGKTVATVSGTVMRWLSEPPVWFETQQQAKDAAIERLARASRPWCGGLITQ